MGKGFRHGAGGAPRKVPVLNEEYPKNVTVEAAGSNVTFTIQISENGSPAEYEYQWYYDDASVSGANSSEYTRSAEFGSHTVYCVVTNEAGMVTSRTATVKATREYLYKAGDQCTSVSGGWVAKALQSRDTYTGRAPSLSKNTTYMSASLNTGDTPGSGVVRTSKTIDFSKYKTLYFDISSASTQYNSVSPVVYTDGISIIGYSGVAFTDTSKVVANRIFGQGKTVSRADYALDVSSINKSYLVGLFFHYQSNKGTISANIYNVWGE